MEEVATRSFPVYISKKNVTKDVSELPRIARQLYSLIDVEKLIEEQIRDPQKQVAIRRHVAQLATINMELKLKRDSREEFVAHKSKDEPKVKQRNDIIAALEVEEITAAADRWGEIDEWARLYVQTPEVLTAYRVYSYREGKGYTLYIEDAVAKPKVMVVCTGFHDTVAREVIEEWCEE